MLRTKDLTLFPRDLGKGIWNKSASISGAKGPAYAGLPGDQLLLSKVFLPT